MEVLIYTSFKEWCLNLYTDIHGSIAVDSCQISLAQKISLYILYEFIHFNLSAGTYSIDDFNAKVKIAILQQREGWEPPPIKDLILVISEDYIFMASNTILIAWYTRQISWKDYVNQANFTLWFIQNISWYITSSKIIVTAL